MMMYFFFSINFTKERDWSMSSCWSVPCHAMPSRNKFEHIIDPVIPFHFGLWLLHHVHSFLWWYKNSIAKGDMRCVHLVLYCTTVLSCYCSCCYDLIHSSGNLAIFSFARFICDSFIAIAIALVSWTLFPSLWFLFYKMKIMIYQIEIIQHFFCDWRPYHILQNDI